MSILKYKNIVCSPIVIVVHEQYAWPIVWPTAGREAERRSPAANQAGRQLALGGLKACCFFC